MPKTFSSAEGAKRHPLTVRTTEAVRKQLEAAASQSGRSLAQELEHRLSRSVELDDLWTPQAGSIVIRLLLSTLRAVEVSRGEMWAESAASKAAVKAALIGILDTVMPDEAGQAEAMAEGVNHAVEQFHKLATALVDEDHEPISKADLKSRMNASTARRRKH